MKKRVQVLQEVASLQDVARLQEVASLQKSASLKVLQVSCFCRSDILYYIFELCLVFGDQLIFSPSKVRKNLNPPYGGQNILMCFLHVLEHFKHF